MTHKGRGAPRHAVEGDMANEPPKDDQQAEPQGENKKGKQPSISVILQSGGFTTGYQLDNMRQLHHVDLRDLTVDPGDQDA